MVKRMTADQKKLSQIFWEIVDAKLRTGGLTQLQQYQVDEINVMIEGGTLVLLSREDLKNSTVDKRVAPGVYELPTGEIYVVKLNRAKTRVYAKRLVEVDSERLSKENKRVKFDFEYESGAIFRIEPDHLMGIERAKQLMIQYGRCIVCGRRLKVAESVERGIGPVCIKYFDGGN